MIENGGTYHHYRSRNTTHVVASNLCSAKIKSTKTDYTVTPQWITDSLAAQKLLDYRKYLLVKVQGKNQPKIHFKSSNLEKNSILYSKDLSSTHCDISDINVNIPQVSLQSSELSNSSSISNDVSRIKNDTLESSSGQKINTSSPSKFHPMNTSNPNFLSEFYSNSRLHHISTSSNTLKQYVKSLKNKEQIFPGREYLKQWVVENPISICKGLSHGEASRHCDNLCKIIMHIDMDCFFVSVGLLRYPQYKGKPIAVTHATKEGISKISKPDFKIRMEHFDDKLQSNQKANEICFSEYSIERDKLIFNEEISTVTNEKKSMAEIASCSYEARAKGVKNGMFLGTALKLCPDLVTMPYDFEGYEAVSHDLYGTVARLVS